MFGKLTFNYNMSYIVDMIKENGNRFVFESDSSIVFKKRGSCLVQILYLGKYTAINIEHIEGDKICRLNIDNKTGKTEMYAYDAEAGEEVDGILSDKDRNDLLKKTKLLYEKKVFIRTVGTSEFLSSVIFESESNEKLECNQKYNKANTTKFKQKKQVAEKKQNKNDKQLNLVEEKTLEKVKKETKKKSNREFKKMTNKTCDVQKDETIYEKMKGIEMGRDAIEKRRNEEEQNRRKRNEFAEAMILKYGGSNKRKSRADRRKHLQN